MIRSCVPDVTGWRHLSRPDTDSRSLERTNAIFCMLLLLATFAASADRSAEITRRRTLSSRAWPTFWMCSYVFRVCIFSTWGFIAEMSNQYWTRKKYLYRMSFCILLIIGSRKIIRIKMHLWTLWRCLSLEFISYKNFELLYSYQNFWIFWKEKKSNHINFHE